MKGCHFLNGLTLKNDKKDNSRTSKLNKDLSQIEFFKVAYQQSFRKVFFLLKQMKSVFFIETNDSPEWNKRAGLSR